MRPSLEERVADYLGYVEQDVRALATKAPATYKHYSIRKKKGGHRTIHHPSKETKALQYALIETFLRSFPVHECAAAYRRNIRSPLLANARSHACFPYSIRIDFTDFFHSIRPQDLVNVAKSNRVNLSRLDRSFLENCLFVKVRGSKKGLAIGAPSSPIVSNIVMYGLDDSIAKLSTTIGNRSAYTRYADDIVFSTNERGGCQRFYDAVQETLGDIASPKLTINASKTIFGSRGTRRVVTGVYIKPDGGTSLGRHNKRYIRKLVFEYKQARLAPDKLAYLGGYLAFALDVEPDFYNRLAVKYGGEIVARALRPGAT